MNSLSDLRIDEVFNEEKAKEYEERFGVIWHELVTAHTSMIAVGKVLDFPREFLFSPGGDQIFLGLVERNFIHQSVLIMINMLTDTQSKNSKKNVPATFESLEDWIKNNCQPEMRDTVSKCLHGISNSPEFASMKNRVLRLRGKFLAHLDWRHALEPSMQSAIQMTREELQVLVSETEEILSKLRVEGGVSLLPLEYSPLIQHPKGSDRRLDIERWLDLLAAESSRLKMPEEQPYLWERHHKDWTEQYKELFNCWRKRIGRDIISF